MRQQNLVKQPAPYLPVKSCSSLIVEGNRGNGTSASVLSIAWQTFVACLAPVQILLSSMAVLNHVSEQLQRTQFIAFFSSSTLAAPYKELSAAHHSMSRPQFTCLITGLPSSVCLVTVLLNGRIGYEFK